MATKRPDLSVEWHPTKNGDLTPYDVTCNSHLKVWWKCSENATHEWDINISARNKGSGCPYCYGRYPTKENNLLVCNPELALEWNYEKNNKKPKDYCTNSNLKVWWKCKICGNEWESTISNRSNNRGCPECNESKGEKKVKEVCKLYNVPHDSQFTFDDLRGISNGLLKFDVPIFWDEEKTQLRMLIEFDGEQHFRWIKGMMTKKDFEKLQYHDKLKNEYCKDNNIKLLRIRYDDFNKIEDILTNQIFNSWKVIKCL